MKILIKLVLALALFTFTLDAKTLSGDQVINSMIKAYGGEENLKKLNSYEQVWHVETMVSNDNGTDKRMVVMPYLLQTELTYPHKTETRILIKDYGTKLYADRRVEASGPMLDAMKLQLMRLFTPLVLKDYKDDIKVTEDKENYILTLYVKGLKAEYYVSKDKYLINKVVGTLSLGAQSMSFVTLYKNFKSIDGVVVPHKEIKYAGDVNTAIMHLRETTFTKPPKHRQ